MLLYRLYTNIIYIQDGLNLSLKMFRNILFQITPNCMLICFLKYLLKPFIEILKALLTLIFSETRVNKN